MAASPDMRTVRTYVYQYLSIALLLFIVVCVARYYIANAATPNPGHPWTDIGNGNWQVANTQTATRTFTFPDADATVLTSNAAVTVAQGGTGAATLTGILKGNGTSAFTAVTAPAGNLVGDTDAQTLTNKTISKASNTLTGIAASGANSDITSLAGLTTPLSVAQGGTGANTLTGALIGNGTGAVTAVAPGTAGNVLSSNGTTWISQTAADMGLYEPVGLHAASVSAVTALTTGVTYFEYVGVAAKAYTSCKVQLTVTTAGATITWAEVAMFTGDPVIGTGVSLTRAGFTSVATTFNSTGNKTTTVSGTINRGDNMWIAFGSSATTPFQVRGLLADAIQSGTFTTATIRPSLAATPQATTIGGAAVVPGWGAVTCQ